MTNFTTELGSSNTKEVEASSELCILGMRALQKAMENFAKFDGGVRERKPCNAGIPDGGFSTERAKEAAKVRVLEPDGNDAFGERRWQPCRVKRRRWCGDKRER
ncbi:hypothetical protein IFM89_034035 [Coptis chinensis]|uniref:Uncharacterized protein n=1 Tax=Coptis chinensis TaxID=261450 RepID=A0A835IS21_9MAGN|nr:hypothetical protein IFM89_034035 [Coptis chinensis]